MINYPELGIERQIRIPKQVLEEGLEIEAAAVKYVKVLEAVHNSLRLLQRGIILSLHFHQKPPQLIDAHGAVLRVVIEYLLDVRRRLRGGESEPPPEAETNSVSLLGHFFF